MRKQINFLKVALSDGQIGAMARSSKYVVRVVVSNFGNQSLFRVVEYGPGDGVVTKEILKKMSKDGELIVAETNRHFVQVLKDIKDPRLKIVEDTAQAVSGEIRSKYKGTVDLVISSIPFTLLKRADREQIVSNTFHMLKSPGKFIVFQYSPMLLKLLSAYFLKKNIKTQIEVRNVPPMFIMSAQK